MPANNESLLADGRLCGCYAGAAYCKAESPRDCFHAGQWYANGAGILTHRGSEWHVCRDGQWTRSKVIPTSDAYVALTFPVGEVELDRYRQSRLQWLSPTAPEDPRRDLKLVIRSWIDPAEGPKARYFARERARRVHAWLVGHGFKKAQVRTSVQDAPHDAPVNDVRITIHDAEVK